MSADGERDALTPHSTARGGAGWWRRAPSTLSLCPSPRRDLKNNLISTVQPGAFLGLPELKRL